MEDVGNIVWARHHVRVLLRLGTLTMLSDRMLAVSEGAALLVFLTAMSSDNIEMGIEAQILLSNERQRRESLKVNGV